jgi:hypothetical protein
MSLTPSAARENESHTRETERKEITLASEHKISPPESRRYFTSNPRESSNLLQAAVTLPLQSQPTTSGKPVISLSRDRQAQAQFQATSTATQQDFMGTEGQANEEHYTANTEDETYNLHATDVADSMTIRIGEQLTSEKFKHVCIRPDSKTPLIYVPCYYFISSELKNNNKSYQVYI